jgi:hypothetical protein
LYPALRPATELGITTIQWARDGGHALGFIIFWLLVAIIVGVASNPWLLVILGGAVVSGMWASATEGPDDPGVHAGYVMAWVLTILFIFLVILEVCSKQAEDEARFEERANQSSEQAASPPGPPCFETQVMVPGVSWRGIMRGPTSGPCNHVAFYVPGGDQAEWSRDVGGAIRDHYVIGNPGLIVLGVREVGAVALDSEGLVWTLNCPNQVAVTSITFVPEREHIRFRCKSSTLVIPLKCFREHSTEAKCDPVSIGRSWTP